MITESRCSQRKCKHYQGIFQPTGKEDGGEFHCCDAFPDRIPDEIAYGSNKHLKPYPGDHGIQFEVDK